MCFGVNLITISEAAELLTIPKAAVYQMSASNQLPGKVMLSSKTVRVDADVLKAWVASGTAGIDEYSREIDSSDAMLPILRNRLEIGETLEDINAVIGALKRIGDRLSLLAV